MSTAEQWFISQRADALTRVLLTRRPDLVISPLHEDDYGAAITLDGQFTLVTRNTDDFRETGISLFNPWTA